MQEKLQAKARHASSGVALPSGQYDRSRL